MRLIPTICVLALVATPVLAQGHLASLEPHGLMHIPPIASAPATIPLLTTAASVEVERKADLARIKSDAFDRRIQQESERAMSSICTGCLAPQPKTAHVRLRLSGNDAASDRAARTASFKSTASATRWHLAGAR